MPEWASEESDWFAEAAQEAERKRGGAGRAIAEAMKEAADQASRPSRPYETAAALREFGMKAPAAAASLAAMGRATTSMAESVRQAQRATALRSFSVEQIQKAIQDNIRKTALLHGPDAALEDAGKWLSKLTNAITEVMKEIDEQ